MTKNANGNSRQTLRDSEQKPAIGESNTTAGQIQHQLWCDPGMHARAIREAHPDDGHPECVGRMIEVVDKAAGLDIDGWWTQDPGDPEPHFALELQGYMYQLDVVDLKVIAKLFLMIGARHVDQIITAANTAVADFEVGVPTEEPS